MSYNSSILKLVECPRDAMQGIDAFIPTQDKVDYISTLLQVGFHTIDVGSFVSPKAIPQMRDTSLVIDQLDLSQTNTKLLAIIANKRGAEQACSFEQISYLGFPLSLSETFQIRNTNKSIEEAFLEIESIQNLLLKFNKSLVVYLSMGFGNPYGDTYTTQFVVNFVHRLDQMGIQLINPSDTIGIASTDEITKLFNSLIPAFPAIEFGAHLHANPIFALEKIKAAHAAGCIRFDSAIGGFGGCPFAEDTLTGNIPTETMVQFCLENKIDSTIDPALFRKAQLKSAEIF